MKHRLLAALLAAGMVLLAFAVPVWTAHRQEQSLPAVVHPRPEVGGILWDPTVRGNPVLYALHRAALQAAAPAPAVTGDTAAVAGQAAVLLDSLLAAGVLAPESHQLLADIVGREPVLAAVDMNGVFGGLRLEVDDPVYAYLDVQWHRGTGVVTRLYAYLTDQTGLCADPEAALDAWCVLLGLEGMEYTDEYGERVYPAVQLQVSCYGSSDAFRLELTALQD